MFNINPFHHQSGVATAPVAMVAITEDGKRAMNNGLVSGRQYSIMIALDQSSMSMSNLAREANMNIRDIQREVMSLRGQGYVAVRNYNNEG